MAERKVQNKFIPADFDPRVLKALSQKEKKQQKRRKTGEEQQPKKETVRVMLPFNICCSNCNSYMYRGRKFNAKKEQGVDASYLNTKVLRFHIRCETCAAPIVYRTDPKSAGFVVVSGASENKTTAGGFNPLADVTEKDELPQDGLDAVAALEARALETKREQEVLNELEQELARSKARNAAALKATEVAQSGLGGQCEENGKALTSEEEAALAAFRDKKRALAFQPTVSVSLESTSAGNADKDNTGGLFIQRAAKKKLKTVTSLVPYDDDSEDE